MMAQPYEEAGPMATRDGSDVRRWLGGLDDGVKGQAEELIRMVGSTDPRIEQAVKWGRMTFTVGGDWHHWLCGVAATKKGARLVFHKGALLEDPDGMLAGSRRYVREVPAEEAKRRPDSVRLLVRSAIAHQTDMLD
jgi:hypothetical protein